MTPQAQQGRADTLTRFLVISAIAMSLFPTVWLLLSSVRPPSQLAAGLSDVTLTVENFRIAIFETGLVRWLGTSLVISLVSTGAGLLFGAMAAFALAQYRFFGRALIFALILLSISVPEYVTLIPSFVIARALGLIDSIWAVILPLIPHGMTVFLLRQYFLQLPGEILDAARIDGAGEFRIFFQIALPMVRPGLAAAAILLFMASWNAYLIPLVMLRSDNLATVTTGLASIYADLSMGNPPYDPWAAIIGTTVISILPLALLLVVMQRHFISGLTAGAVK
jgi:ABC-type glycerol-3-phosphate transport system permease component